MWMMDEGLQHQQIKWELSDHGFQIFYYVIKCFFHILVLLLNN